NDGISGYILCTSYLVLTDFCHFSREFPGCYAFWCYFCVLHQLTKSLKEHTCLPCLPWCGLLALRVKMRTIYGIHGSACRDCSHLCFCNGCSACQMHREGVELGIIEKRGCSSTLRNVCACYVQL
ncbi:uncharacterized protein DEA37_0005377, partial [Paragonimus westermani]